VLTVARARALFASGLATGSKPCPAEVDDEIRRAVQGHGGSRGCTLALAGAYGDHPEAAAPRMRWALDVVRATYPRRASYPRRDRRCRAIGR
jgi:hypothetical protein